MAEHELEHWWNWWGSVQYPQDYPDWVSERQQGVDMNETLMSNVYPFLRDRDADGGEA